jgi:hypothetical protein
MLCRNKTRNVASLWWVAVALILATVAPPAMAVDFSAGDSDFKIRWDNTVKYSAGYRLINPADELTSALPQTLNQDDGDRNFTKGFMQNRFDLLTELDASYKNVGVRVSGAGWYDFVYNQSNSNTSFGTANAVSVPYNQFTRTTQRLAGKQFEILDAFAFAKIQAGEQSGSFKVGRHALQWGESLFFGANGIAGTMAPTDVMKLLGVPNAQFKEIIMPVNQISAQWQFTPSFTVAAYYQLEWSRSRLPAVGSYYSSIDILDGGGERLITGAPGGPFVAPPAFYRTEDQNAKNGGQYGIKVGLRAAETDFGLYFTNYHDKNPQIYFRPQAVPDFMTGQIGTYQLAFQQDIKAIGVSASRSVGVWNLAAEVSYKIDNDLVSDAQTVPPIPGFLADNSGNPLYAIGDTFQAQASWLATFGPSFLAQESSFLGEVAYNRTMKVTKNEAAIDPHTTRDALGFRVVFEPMYRQALPGLDISVPLGIGYNPKGTSQVVSNFNGGVGEGGDFNLGVSGTYLGVYKFSLTYTSYIGAAGTFLDANNQLSFKQSLKDRDALNFSVRTTF